MQMQMYPIWAFWRMSFDRDSPYQFNDFFGRVQDVLQMSSLQKWPVLDAVNTVSSFQKIRRYKLVNA